MIVEALIAVTLGAVIVGCVIGGLSHREESTASDAEPVFDMSEYKPGFYLAKNGKPIESPYQALARRLNSDRIEFYRDTPFEQLKQRNKEWLRHVFEQLNPDYSYRQIAAILNETGITTARGTPWTYRNVSNRFVRFGIIKVKQQAGRKTEASTDE